MPSWLKPAIIRARWGSLNNSRRCACRHPLRRRRRTAPPDRCDRLAQYWLPARPFSQNSRPLPGRLCRGCLSHERKNTRKGHAGMALPKFPSRRVTTGIRIAYAVLGPPLTIRRKMHGALPLRHRGPIKPERSKSTERTLIRQKMGNIPKEAPRLLGPDASALARPRRYQQSVLPYEGGWLSDLRISRS
jgi:hypothetical protein